MKSLESKVQGLKPTGCFQAMGLTNCIQLFNLYSPTGGGLGELALEKRQVLGEDLVVKRLAHGGAVLVRHGETEARAGA
jgi:hypothetical protein